VDDDVGYGWRSFAGILITISGFFNAIDGLVAIINANRIQGVVNGQVTLPVTDKVSSWGWLVLIVGIVMIIAGFSIFSGATWARVVGIVVVSINMVVQFSYLAHFPFWSFTMILVDTMVIYGLVVHGRPERRAQPGG
jgi:Ca2+/Na+ antiporter